MLDDSDIFTKAKKIRERMSHLTGTTSYSSDTFNRDAVAHEAKAPRYDSSDPEV